MHNGDDINLDSFYYATRVGSSIDQWYLRTWGGVDPADGRPYYLVGGDQEMVKLVKKLLILTLMLSKHGKVLRTNLFKVVVGTRLNGKVSLLMQILCFSNRS